MEIDLKLRLGDECRRVSARSLSLEEALAASRGIFSLDDQVEVRLRYTDADGDLVTVSTDAEFPQYLKFRSRTADNTSVVHRFDVVVTSPANKDIPTTITSTGSAERVAILSVTDEVCSAVVHRGVTCDRCGISPIVGPRFKCTVRSNFDLCAGCEAVAVPSHTMLKIYNNDFSVTRRRDEPKDKEVVPATIPQARSGRLSIKDNGSIFQRDYSLLSSQSDSTLTLRYEGFRKVRSISLVGAKLKRLGDVLRVIDAKKGTIKILVADDEALALAIAEHVGWANCIETIKTAESTLSAGDVLDVKTCSSDSIDVARAAAETSANNNESGGKCEAKVDVVDVKCTAVLDIPAVETSATNSIAKDCVLVANNDTIVTTSSMHMSCVSRDRSGSDLAILKPTARLVYDVTYPDFSVVSPSTDFVKVWLVRNDGTNDWPAGVRLVCAGGDRLCDDCTSVAVPSAAVGCEVQVAVALRSPADAGRYVSYFKLLTENGAVFGQKLWVDVQVAVPLATGIISPAFNGASLRSNPTVTGTLVPSGSAGPVNTVPGKFVVQFQNPAPESDQARAVSDDDDAHIDFEKNASDQDWLRDRTALEREWKVELDALSAMGFADSRKNIALMQMFSVSSYNRYPYLHGKSFGDALPSILDALLHEV